jgi:hypothetical protein
MPSLIKARTSKTRLSVELQPINDDVQIKVVCDAIWVTVKIGKRRNQKYADEFQGHLLNEFRISPRVSPKREEVTRPNYYSGFVDVGKVRAGANLKVVAKVGDYTSDTVTTNSAGYYDSLEVKPPNASYKGLPIGFYVEGRKVSKTENYMGGGHSPNFWNLEHEPEMKDKGEQLEEWWGKYRPSCGIVKVGYLEITKDANAYHFELPIDVKYVSRDPRYSTRMDCTTILMDVLHTGTDREKVPYRLHSSTLPLRIEPLISEGRYRVIQQKWDLPSNESRIIRHTFIGQTEGEPLIENETFCKVLAIGIPLIKNVPIIKPLMIEDSKLPLTVDDGKFLVKIDKQYHLGC